MKKIKDNKVFLILIIALITCSCNPHWHLYDSNYWTKTSRIKLNEQVFSESKHFLYNNYVITVHDSIGTKIIQEIYNEDYADILLKDTINIESERQGVIHWFKYELHYCFENNYAQLYSIVEQTYISKIKRTVSYANQDKIHHWYRYTNPKNNDTILYIQRIDLGCPAF